MTPEQIQSLIKRAAKLTPEQLKPIRLNSSDFVRYPARFINMHVARIQSGNKSAKPYAERLEQYLNLVNG